MIYLGIDLSLTGTGLCVLDSNKPNWIKVNLIKTNKRGCRRLRYIKEKIALCTELFKPDIVVLEGYSYGSRTGQAFSIGELGGVVKLELFFKYKTLIVPPTCLKKFITGKGTTGKDIMLLKTFKKYGVEFTDNNKCDAFGLAQMGKTFTESTKIGYEREALEKIKFLE